MPRRPSTFTQADVSRVVKAARASGLNVGVVEVTLDGTIRVSVGDDLSRKISDDPFDRWRESKNAYQA